MGEGGGKRPGTPSWTVAEEPGWPVGICQGGKHGGGVLGVEWREGVNPVQDVVSLRDESKGDALEPAAWMLSFLGASMGTQGKEHYCERARATFVRDTNEEQPAGRTGRWGEILEEINKLICVYYTMNLLPETQQIISLDKGFAILKGRFKIHVCSIFRICHHKYLIWKSFLIPELKPCLN